ncbi:RDD family protein [Methanoculleus sp. Wushi-C6]|uniref:RDD family protein n=1 Tax=Methanoculleus caldifontis TaxID=2651577 RepID=A0ABU3WXV7_9EURY|nr:RDD family protein [Methanoculleus sp. Wushi-C6]MDV2480637.1 RDD family protein [Methanoculleus sp. Wushi-C6]
MATIYLARWETRFWAWLIDIILIGLPFWALSDYLPPAWRFTIDPGLISISLSSVVLFLYWTLLEGYRGQSIGKMALKIRVTGRAGEDIGFGAAAAESIGKAFLLVPDCLIGWLAMPGSKQRLFNRISNTIVIETREREEPEGVTYVKSEE